MHSSSSRAPSASPLVPKALRAGRWERKNVTYTSFIAAHSRNVGQHHGTLDHPVRAGSVPGQRRRDIAERLPGFGADASWHQLTGAVGAELAGEIQHVTHAAPPPKRQATPAGHGKELGGGTASLLRWHRRRGTGQTQARSPPSAAGRSFHLRTKERSASVGSSDRRTAPPRGRDAAEVDSAGRTLSSHLGLSPSLLPAPARSVSASSMARTRRSAAHRRCGSARTPG